MIRGPPHSNGPFSVGTTVTLPGDNVSCGTLGGRNPASLNPALAWVPSQNGLSRDIPQRHSTMVTGGAALVARVPATTTSPETTFGPSGRTRSTVAAKAAPTGSG